MDKDTMLVLSSIPTDKGHEVKVEFQGIETDVLFMLYRLLNDLFNGIADGDKEMKIMQEKAFFSDYLKIQSYECGVDEAVKQAMDIFSN